MDGQGRPQDTGGGLDTMRGEMSYGRNYLEGMQGYLAPKETLTP